MKLPENDLKLVCVGQSIMNTCALCSGSEVASIEKACGHCFHPVCLEGWISVTNMDSAVCPMCVAKDCTQHYSKRILVVEEFDKHQSEVPNKRKITMPRAWKRYVFVTCFTVFLLSQLGTAFWWWIVFAMILTELWEFQRVCHYSRRVPA